MFIEKYKENKRTIVYHIGHHCKNYVDKDRIIELSVMSNSILKFEYVWSGKSKVYWKKR